MCTPACPSNPCHIDDLQGACAWGEWVCPPGQDPWCEQTVFAEPEVCNGEDDDCNGDVDDIPPDACDDGEVQHASCQEGFKVAGTMRCVGNEARCIARPCNTDDPNDTGCYCTHCGAGIGGNGGPCGECSGTPCIPDLTACEPSFECSSSPGGPPPPSTCQHDNTCLIAPSCWTPADVRLPPNHCYGSE